MLRAARFRPVALAAAVLAFAGTVGARDVPYLTGRVNDTAGMLPIEVRERLQNRLAEFEKVSGAQVAVLTIASLEGEPVEEYALKVGQTWKLGRKGVDDGALLLVARDDRQMRIEVGYGLEAKLTDIACKRILDDVMRPAFRDGQFGPGVEAGVDAIIGTIQGKDVLPPRAPAPLRSAALTPLGVRLFATLLFVIVIGVFSVVALVGQGCMSWFLYVFLMPFYAAFPFALWGPPGAALIPIWILGFPIAKLVLGKTVAGKSFLAAHPGLIAFAASSGHAGSGGGWSSAGGFSGGGGSFGGGGASSSW
ncbi:MAG: TPM domain-containing protein [Thermoanaerobaculaceae bacterium]